MGKRGPPIRLIRLVALLASAIVASTGCHASTAEPAAGPRPPEVNVPRSARGRLRVSAFAPRPVGESSLQLHTTVFVPDTSYRVMEDNDIRGFLDGRTKVRWNQVHQPRVRIGRRHSRARFGEYELFRALQRWDRIDLPASSRVRRARLDMAVESGPGTPLTVLLYEVKREWGHGGGGLIHDDHSPILKGEVWWNEAAHDIEPWGLPGANYASDADPAADIGAMPLAEARWERGHERVVFESEALAAYVEGRSAAGRPLLFLLKLANPHEDRPRTQLFLFSRDADVDRDPARRPHLVLDWESAAQSAASERHVHLEHGRMLTLPGFDLNGGDTLVATFASTEDSDPPVVEVRASDGSVGWTRADRPIRIGAGKVDVRVRAIVDPIPWGDLFDQTVRETWVSDGQPENHVMTWIFRSPSNAIHEVKAAYAGNHEWRVSFLPNEIGRWSYVYEHDLNANFPYRSAEGAFDVTADERSRIHAYLRDLMDRIAAHDPADAVDLVSVYGREFWAVERAAMELETPESYRGPSGRETLDLLSKVRAALARRRHVPDPPLVPRRIREQMGADGRG